MLQERRTLGVVGMSANFINNHEHSASFLAAILKAWAYFAAHEDEVNAWYVEDTKVHYSPGLLRAAAQIDPAMKATSAKDVDLRLTDAHAAELDRSADWAFRYGFTKTKADVRRAIDRSALEAAYDLL